MRNGETLGIIGQNGAGKSTLLKILSGIVIPDTGRIHVDGKVTGLLELGTGFNYEMTGLENIYMNGTLIGMTRDEINQKKQIIIDFSELGDFINEPLKTYSSGMTMRLAFAIAIHADPTCFLVDEALAVGDAYFQQKCMRKIQEFRESGGSIIFVSHDMNAVRMLCDNTLLLDRGQVISSGKTKTVVDFYQGMMLLKMHQGETEVKINKTIGKNDYNLKIGTDEVKLVSLTICDINNAEISSVESGDLIKIICRVQALKELSEPHYGLIIRNYLGVSVFETNTQLMRMKPNDLKKSEISSVTFEMKIPLVAGTYSISIGIAQNGYGRGIFEEYLLLMYDIKVFKVLENKQAIIFGGIFNMDPKVTIE